MSLGASHALDASVLVLNKFYMAVHVISVRRAFCLLFKDLAEVDHPRRRPLPVVRLPELARGLRGPRPRSRSPTTTSSAPSTSRSRSPASSAC